MALVKTQVSGHVLYTIGYGGKGAAQFVEALTTHHIDVVVDVRRWPSTRNVPYA